MTKSKTTMIFRQLFDNVSGTYSYLLASRSGGEALILDPVLEKVDRYCQLLRELDLKLVKAVDTHLHADHVTGLGELRDRTHCVTIMGEQSKADVVAMRVGDGDRVMIEGLSLDVMYTPGHTDDSYSYLMADRVFHRRYAADPRHRPHRFPERQRAGTIRFDFWPAPETAG
jgi:glyoxylase-like metal-dependent hydrolase (beta-lactamase superfamily II)